MTDITLGCKCGKVQGVAEKVSSKVGNHLICYCEDCQNFAKALGNEAVLDSNGGSDIFQLPPCKLKITQGKEQLRCLKLTPKGPNRWYTDCCNTPVANTFAAGMPLVGLLACFIANDKDKSALGEVRFYIQGQHAKGELADKNVHPKFPPKLIRTIMRQALWGKLLGRHKTSPFYDAGGQPVAQPDLHY